MRSVVASLMLALVCATAGEARADPASVAASIRPEGYARIVFTFDRAPGVGARLANGVLVVSFDRPVPLETTDLVRGLASLIGVARVDPDQTAIRMSLIKPVKLVATPAGEKFFVDLLPTSWAGLPPPLPLDVIAELTREAREARDVKAEEARRRATPGQTLKLKGATHPTFRRLVFALGSDARVTWRRDGPRVVVSIDAPLAFDAAAAGARLPLEFAGLSAARKDGRLDVSVPAPGAGAVRGFEEDGDFILDIDRDDAPAAQTGAAAVGDPHPAAANAAVERHHPAGQTNAVSASPVSLGPAADRHPAPAPRTTTPAEPAPHAEAPRPAEPAPVKAVEPASSRAPSLVRVGETTRLTFPFARTTPAAMFQRGRVLWTVFDDPSPLGVEALVAASGGAIVAAQEFPVEQGRAARFTLSEPRLVTVAAEREDWIVSLGEALLQRSGAVTFDATFDAAGKAAIKAELPSLGAVRTIADPDIGDEIVVATLGPPARATQRPRQFVEFSALATAQGIALSMSADDLRVEAGVEQLTISREGGLTLSTAQAPQATPAPDGAMVLDATSWDEETTRPFSARENELMLGAALASAENRPAARLALARFYVIRGRAADAKSVLGAIIEDGGFSERDERVAILRGAAEVDLGRPRTALAILSTPTLRLKPEAALWRAAAEYGAGRPGPARAAFKEGESALETMPQAMKARFVKLAVDLALAARDGAAAAAAFERLEVLPIVEGVAARELARARISEALDRPERAAASYAMIAKGTDPAASAQAELLGIELGLRTKTLSGADAVSRLERLVTGWRGDETEAEALARLIALYGDLNRWRDAFSTLRVAVEAFPDADGTRALQDVMQGRFTELFLGAGADEMPKLDALALFYDFKELSPGGRRGDELVRRLADKLVEVELLDQAADLLNYQIDNRLSGAGRAQVAARSALVDLMNAKPQRALETLRKTRQADLPASLMRTRLRLEARALAETGRVDLALEIAAGLEGPEAVRLKADILWSARRWPEAGEALEAALGSRWRGEAPLEAGERADVMRAAIASALAGDGLAVDRIRQKFSAKMGASPESAGFEIVTAPIEARGAAFREVARSVAATSSFEAFQREYRRSAEPAEAPADARTASKA